MSPSDGPNHRRLLQLQKRVYKSLEAEVERLIGDPPASIRRYEAEYERDFREPRRHAAVGKDELVRRARESDVIFVADFHTFAQAQKTAIRLMRDAGVPGQPCLLGLEMISSRFQGILDRFQAGKLTEKKFLQLIRYRDEWGFPWKNYQAVFEWARENGVRLIALNRPRELDSLSPWKDERARRAGRSRKGPRARLDAYELAARDQWSAGVITDVFHWERGRGNRPRMFVLYGELHLGRSHLPGALERISRAFLGKPLRQLTVHQNRDELYWRLAEKGRETETEVLRLGRSSYCVFSGTPWARLQSLISWVEGEASGHASLAARGTGVSGEPSAEVEDESEVDYLSLMRVCGQTIAEFLGIRAPGFENLSACTIAEADFVDGLGGDSRFSRRELGLIRLHVMTNQRLYVPKAEVAYLASPSFNGSAELAATYLMTELTGCQSVFTGGSDDFYRLALQAAFAFFGSLILNPRRKCDHPADHVNRLSDLAHGDPPTYRQEREARKLAVAVLRARTGATPLPETVSGQDASFAAMMAARYVGQVLGKKLHQAVLREKVRTFALRKLFLAPLDETEESYHDRYLALVRMSSSAPIAASKTASF